MKTTKLILIVACWLCCGVAAALTAHTTLTACTSKQSPQTSYRVAGTIAGLPDSTVLTLTPVSHDREQPVAEAVVSSGKFEFQGEREFPIMVRLAVKDSWGGTVLMLENVNIAIEGTAEVKPGEGGNPSTVSFNDLKITGSPLTDKLRSYQARRDSLDVLYKEYHERNKEGQELMMQARQSKDPAKMKAAQDNESWKAFEADEHKFFQTVESTFQAIIDENKDTYWGPMMAIYLYSYFTPEQQALFKSFSKEAQQSYYGEKMRDEVFPGGEVGSPAKAFTVKGDDGKELTLKQLSEGKKVVLIDFWASWCTPCRKEIPNVKAQYAKYKDKGFQVVSISIDKDEAAWRKALAEEKLEWPNFIDRSGAADVYKVRTIPAMFLVDAQTQNIIAAGDNARGEALAAKLAELFK
jgi:peroxiredoxin